MSEEEREGEGEGREAEGLRICCCGKFPFVWVFGDVSLSEELFQISTQKSAQQEIGCDNNYRIVQIPFCDDISHQRRVFAVSGFSSPYPILVYDMNSKQQISHCMGHQSSVWGLTSISSNLSSENPKIVSGGIDDSQILVFDAIEGTKLCQLPNAPCSTFRLLHVPEWNQRSDVFVGGWDSDGVELLERVYRYDLTTERKIGQYDGHTDSVNGLTACLSQNLVISASDDTTVRLWSRDEYTCQSVVNVSSEAYCCYFVEEKNLILVGLENGTIEVYDIRQMTNEPVGTVKIGSSDETTVYDIARIDEDRFVCGGVWDDGDEEAEGEDECCLCVFKLSSCQILSKSGDLGGDVFGVCVFGSADGSSDSSRVPTAVTSELESRCLQLEADLALLEQSRRELEERLQKKEEERTRDLAEKELELSLKDELFQEKQRALASTQELLQEKEMALASHQELLREKETEVSSKDELLASKEQHLQQTLQELNGDGLTERTRRLLRRVDTDIVLSLHLAEQYRQGGCIEFREHILQPVDELEQLRGAASHDQFPFHDTWFGRSRLSVVPSEGEEEDVSLIETVVVDLSKDTPFFEMLTSCDVTQDAVEDLQENWEEFHRTERVYLTGKLMEVCEASTRRLVNRVIGHIFRFFGGRIGDELISRFEGKFHDDQSECLLGDLESCGLGRHRSLCFKVVCDLLRIPCRLIRGWRRVDDSRCGDAWCLVNLCDRLFYVDLVDQGCLVENFDPILCEQQRGLHQEEDELSIDLARLVHEYPALPKEDLGHGGFGDVFGVDFSGEAIAVKEVNLTKRISVEGFAANARVRRELNLMSSFRHPDILPILGSFSFVRHATVVRTRRRRRSKPSSGGESIVALVMPFFDENGNKFRAILHGVEHRLVALRETLILLLSVANGLRYLHSLSILHLDLKPDNILVNLTEDDTLSDVRICDFGGSRQYCTLMSFSALPVSLGFCSPEVEMAAKGDETVIIDALSDVYSFGAVMRFYNCFFGTFSQLFQLCDRCLMTDRIHRPGLVEVMAILRSHLLFVDGKLLRFQRKKRE